MPHSARYLPSFLATKSLFGISVVNLCLVVLSGSVYGQEPGQTPRPKVDDSVVQPIPDDLKVRLDKSLKRFEAVTDGPFRLRGQDEQLPPGFLEKGNIEMEAYNYVLAHAAKQPLDLLRKYSAKDVPIQNLWADVRRDYFRDLIYLKGILRRLQPLKPDDALYKDDGISKIYEAWIIPEGASNFICLVVSELPEGIELGADLNVRVAFDAYYFKHYHYESGQKKADGKHQWMAAPLFIGRSFENLGPVPSDGPVFSGTMLVSVLAGLSTIVLVAVTLGVWFRRGDRRVRAATERRLQESVSFENIPDDGTPANRISEHQ